MKSKKDLMDVYDVVGKDSGDIRQNHSLPILRLINFQEVYPKVNEKFPLHFHTSFELIIPLAKHYKCTLCNRPIIVEKGSFILMQPGQSHSDDLSVDEPFLCIHFSLFQADIKKNNPQLFVPGVLPEKQIAIIQESQFINDIFSLATKYKEQSIPLYVFDHIFLALFQLFIKAYPPEIIKLNSSIENIQNYTYQRIFNYFNDCLSNNNFSINEFCKVLNCSPRTLSRICNEYFYQSPYKAFQTYRLQVTLRYLQENPNATVKETAQLFGYPDAFQFSKAFKKVFSISPSSVKYSLE